MKHLGRENLEVTLIRASKGMPFHYLGSSNGCVNSRRHIRLGHRDRNLTKAPIKAGKVVSNLHIIMVRIILGWRVDLGVIRVEEQVGGLLWRPIAVPRRNLTIYKVVVKAR